MSRLSELDYSNRVSEVAKAMLNGYSNRRNLIQYITETFEWGVCERQLDNYIRDAKEIINEISKNDLVFEKNLALNRLDSLYYMNWKIQDFRECRAVIESRSDLLGIAAPTKQHIDTNITQRTIIIDTTGNQDTQVHPETGRS